MTNYTELEFDASSIEINPLDRLLFSIIVSVDNHDLDKIADKIPVSDICNCDSRKNELLNEIGEDYIRTYFDID